VSRSDQRTAIVVAEDDQDILDLVQIRLEQDGYEVLTARNGEEALSLCRQHQPALALLDVQMPKLNGYEVTRQLRAGERTRGIAIVILTASVRDTEVARAFEAGANDFLRKPFSPAELAARVRAALEAAPTPGR
jgi:two-component system phosphate regulon response regulator PhoB